MAKFFYAKECPLGHECSEQNFKSWSPWGWTEEACRAQVLRHLKAGGKHKENVPKGESRGDMYETLVAEMELYEDVYDQSQHVPKRRRVEDGFAESMPKMIVGPQQPTHPPDFVMLMGRASASSSSGAPVTRQDLREVSDALNRCVTSARHAQRLSAMAAKAFDDEAVIFEEVKAYMDAKMSLLRD